MTAPPNSIQYLFFDLTDDELAAELRRRNRIGLHLFNREQGWVQERYRNGSTFYEPAAYVWGDQ